MTGTAATLASHVRDHAHDLRNLFAAISSAGCMLSRCSSDDQRVPLLRAIEEAAQRGGRLTTRMLQPPPDRRPERLDLRQRLLALEPLLHTTAGPRNKLLLEVTRLPISIWTAADAVDRVIIELVSNARKALEQPGTITVRLKARRALATLIVSDTGRGMDLENCGALLSNDAPPGAHGTGFQQINRFASGLGGRVRLRSVPGRGTIVAVDLPARATPR
jgi:signal transduction histidine kinase